MRVPHPIPYQGSKRKIAGVILSLFPADTDRLIEPFAGSAAVSLAAACHGKARRFLLNDLNEPLVRLWKMIVDHPETMAAQYERLWTAQLGRERDYYDHVREVFNRTQRPDCMLYLLARCVKASVRYNANGDFNQSPDNRRKGAEPETMRMHVRGASDLLRGKTAVMCRDYTAALAEASANDVVYMDPPYQGVCGNRDPRYLKALPFEHFAEALAELNGRDISYIVNYDGRTGDKVHGRSLPEALHLRHFEIAAGRSSQATLLGRDSLTYESLYVSPALMDRLPRVRAPQSDSSRQLKVRAQSAEAAMPDCAKEVLRRHVAALEPIRIGRIVAVVDVVILSAAKDLAPRTCQILHPG